MTVGKKKPVAKAAKPAKIEKTAEYTIELCSPVKDLVCVPRTVCSPKFKVCDPIREKIINEICTPSIVIDKPPLCGIACMVQCMVLDRDHFDDRINEMTKQYATLVKQVAGLKTAVDAQAAKTAKEVAALRKTIR